MSPRAMALARPGCRPGRRPTPSTSARRSSGWGTAPARPARCGARAGTRGACPGAASRNARGSATACGASSVGALQLQQERPHQQQEGDEAGHRVAGQADETCASPTCRYAKRLAGLHRDLPQVERAQSACTAGLMWSSSPTDTPPLVRIRSWPCAASRSACAVASSRSGTMPRSVHLAAEALQQAAQEEAVGVVDRAGLHRRRHLPGITSSSPVENSATRGRRATCSGRAPTRAARPSAAASGARRAPAPCAPRVMSSPLRRIHWPAAGTRVDAHAAVADALRVVFLHHDRIGARRASARR